VHVVVTETDYQGFAILYLERAGQLSVKLYGAWWPCIHIGAPVLQAQGAILVGLGKSRWTHRPSLSLLLTWHA
jgi:hypothetical protein